MPFACCVIEPGIGRPGGFRVVEPPTGPPKLIAGDRWRRFTWESREEEDRVLGVSGSGYSEYAPPEPDLDRLMRLLTGGSL